MKIKKILSCLMSAVMLVSVTVPEMVRRDSAMATESTDPPTFMENEPTITADSSLGGFITNAMKSEDIIEAGEQESDVQYSGDYGIEDVTFDPDTSTLSLYTWQIEDCIAVVGFYSDDGKRMYTSEKVEISKDDEITTFDVDTTKLPESFLVEAYLINDQLMPLCNSYVYNKMTKEMQEILAKTVNDFNPELVVQIDETDDTNNFYVLRDNTILLDSNPDTNTVISADFETGTYVFGNIDDSMRNLAEGDIFSAATDMGVIAAEIETITIDGDTATIVGTSDKEALFQFIKIDTSEMDPSLLDDYTVDMSGADEGVSLSDKSFDETEIPQDEDSLTGQETAEDNFASIGNAAPDTLAPKGEIKASGGIKAEPTFTVKIPKDKKDSSQTKDKKDSSQTTDDDHFKLSGNVSFVISVPMEQKIEFYTYAGYYSVEYKAGYATKVKGSASVQGELKIPLGKIDIPCYGVIHLSLTPSIVVRGSGELSATYQRLYSTGFKYDTNSKACRLIDGLKLKIEDEFEVKVEANFFLGFEFEFSGYIFNKETCSITIPIDIGLNIKATLPIITDKWSPSFKNGQTREGAILHIAEYSDEEFPDVLYNCDVFAEIDADLQLNVSAELKIADYKWNILRDNMKIKVELIDASWNIGKYYLAVSHDKTTGKINFDFGKWDELSNKNYVFYKTSVKVRDKKHKPIKGAIVDYDDANDEVTTDISGDVIYYLPPGQYVFTCNKNDEYLSHFTEVINNARTVAFAMKKNSYDPAEPDSPEAQESLPYLRWEEIENGELSIVDCDESAVKITIPREIEGKPVTRIGSPGNAFEDCTKLTEVTIPDSVKEITTYSFRNCTRLKTITLPDGLFYLADGLFMECTSLTKIAIPDGVVVIGTSFYGCSDLKDITIPDSVTVIDSQAFRECNSLTEMTLSENVSKIGWSAFYRCDSLKSITILDPDCEIYDDENTISNDYKNGSSFFNGTIYGYEGSTAQEYAEKYGYNFAPISGSGGAVPTSYLPATKTASEPVETEFTFTQEVPAADIYNFYVFADENTADLLSADNLLYIKQIQTTSDELSVEIPYILDGDYPDRVERLVRFESPDPGLLTGETSDSETISLIDYTGSAEELEISSEMNGKPVASIESGAFEGCVSLVSVTVPESISSIGESAFAGCENLSALTIQNPDCVIFDSAYTICNGFDEESSEPFFNGTIYGHEGSTAQAYAEKYGYNFEVLGEKSDTDHKLGDLDGDGVIDFTDASSVLAEYSAIQTGAAPAVSTSVGDVNGDGFIDASDASDILQFYAYIQTGGTDSLSEFLRTR